MTNNYISSGQLLFQEWSDRHTAPTWLTRILQDVQIALEEGDFLRAVKLFIGLVGDLKKEDRDLLRAWPTFLACAQHEAAEVDDRYHYLARYLIEPSFVANVLQAAQAGYVLTSILHEGLVRGVRLIVQEAMYNGKKVFLCNGKAYSSLSYLVD